MNQLRELFLRLAWLESSFESDRERVQCCFPAGSETISALRAEAFDRDQRALRGAGYERIDQLVIDHLLGASGQ